MYQTIDGVDKIKKQQLNKNIKIIWRMFQTIDGVNK